MLSSSDNVDSPSVMGMRDIVNGGKQGRRGTVTWKMYMRSMIINAMEQR
jgi:hypothetical protein